MKLDYTGDKPIGHRATLGLIVLKSDETLEHEMGWMIRGDGVALYVSRIDSAAEVSAETLAQMEADLPASAGLLPASLAFDVIGYGCTSAATIIGPQNVSRLVASAAKVRHVTNPISAVLAACSALRVSRLGFVTPYVADVSAAMRGRIEAAGVAISAFGSWEEAEEVKVARMSPQSILDAAVLVGRQAPCDAVFLSCTNLHALDIIAEAEEALGVPVLTSNQALAWHMLTLAGLPGAGARFGTLMGM